MSDKQTEKVTWAANGTSLVRCDGTSRHVFDYARLENALDDLAVKMNEVTYLRERLRVTSADHDALYSRLYSSGGYQGGFWGQVIGGLGVERRETPASVTIGLIHQLEAESARLTEHNKDLHTQVEELHGRVDLWKTRATHVGDALRILVEAIEAVLGKRIAHAGPLALALYDALDEASRLLSEQPSA